MAGITSRHSVMLLYSDTVSPEGHVVRLVLKEKNISAEINFLQVGERPEELAGISPYHTVVTLIDRDLALYDAQIIAEYLNERYPYPPLLPVEPVARAGNRQFRFRVLQDLYASIVDIEGEDKTQAKRARKTMQDSLTSIAPIFMRKPYFMSEEYTLVDCFMAPLLWRLPWYGVELKAPAKPLAKYAKRLFEREAFKASMSDAEQGMGR